MFRRKLKTCATSHLIGFLTPRSPVGDEVMRSIFLVPLAFLLTSCMSTGVKVDQSKLTEFHKGKTNYDQVVEQLGPPTQTTITDQGGKIISYTYMSAQARPESFIPLVGVFVAGADTEQSTVAFTFDQKDILRNYSSTQGSMGAGNGFEAQSQPLNYAQPRKD